MPHIRNLAAPATWHTMDLRWGLCDSPDENVLLFEDEAIGLHDCSVVLSKAHKATLFRPDGRATDAATTQSQTPCTMYSTCAMTLKPFQTIKLFAVVFSCRASLGWLRCFVSRDMATCPSPSPVHLKIVNRPVASFCLQTQHRRS